MSFLSYTTRRSLNVGLSHTRPVARWPLAVRTLSSAATQPRERDAIKHAPGWRHEDASESEANVKADREPPPQDVKSMQHESVKHLKDRASGDELSSSATTAATTQAIHDLKNKAQSLGEDLSGMGHEYAQKARGVGEKVAENVTQATTAAGDYAGKHGQEFSDKTKEAVRPTTGPGAGTGENVMGSVKSGAEKVGRFVKESVDSAKKAVGMGK
ncbi:hypothetical protein B0O80DRAFT_432967 [Mortierella sp. GBAus27b]|nr:hypothetical protein BGX31_008352 [Mortierella sp. GBA43]KAI8363205.1 hypothetical protein B0O80DRAFT_432967 [Mortierella sp. GBAus27b]